MLHYEWIVLLLIENAKKLQNAVNFKVILLVNWCIWLTNCHIFFDFFSQNFVTFMLDKSQNQLIKSLQTILLMLLKHLIILLTTSSSRLAATAVCSLNFVHISDNIHTGTKLINHQITKLVKFIIIDEFLYFLHSLFKLFDFFAHLLTLSDSRIYCDEISEFLTNALALCVSAFKFRKRLLNLLELILVLFILVLVHRLDNILRRICQIINGCLTMHLKLEIKIIQLSQDLFMISFIFSFFWVKID